MAKTVNFEFWRLNIIDDKKNEIIPFKNILEKLEKKPLKISEESHRYYCVNQLCYRAISNIIEFNDGKLISFSKYENQDIKGGYLEDGASEFDAIQKLKEAINRDDVAIIEYNRLKIYNNGVVVFQVNSKANTMKQLKEYLEYHCENEYSFELIQIYKNELFEQIEKGYVHDITLKVGFQPTDSMDHFDEESYSGALTAELKLKKGKDNFLKKTYLKSILFTKKLTGFGTLDNGIITYAQANISNKNSKKPVPISLDKYQLKDSKVFNDMTFYYMEPNKFIDELYHKHKDFLDEYVSRDTRF